MSENRMNELVQKLVQKLQIKRLEAMENETFPYFSVFGEEYGLLVDWMTGTLPVDIPESVRIIYLDDQEDGHGYMGCIRFYVERNEDVNDEPQDAKFVFDEAEYDLQKEKGRVEVLEELLEDIFSN